MWARLSSLSDASRLVHSDEGDAELISKIKAAKLAFFIDLTGSNEGGRPKAIFNIKHDLNLILLLL